MRGEPDEPSPTQHGAPPEVAAHGVAEQRPTHCAGVAEGEEEQQVGRVRRGEVSGGEQDEVAGQEGQGHPGLLDEDQRAEEQVRLEAVEVADQLQDWTLWAALRRREANSWSGAKHRRRPARLGSS